MSVAIVGLDGAGKTTVTRRLVAGLPYETIYLYMGMNPASSNVSLPTTRLVHSRKRRAAAAGAAGTVSLHGVSERRRQRSGAWSALRLANRLAEESVRHAISWFHQRRGRLVVTDRDFFIDYSVAAKAPLGWLDRIHLWCLGKVMPKPDLVVWLDAPPAVLYERKPEVPISYLERRRARMAALGPEFGRFETVDAECPEDEVFERVEALVLTACEGRPVRRRGEGTPP